MKAHYYREDDFIGYLIPEELVKKFDRDFKMLDTASMDDSDDGELYYQLSEEFEEKYSKYIVDDITEVKVYL